MNEARLARYLSINDFRHAARRRLPRAVFDFIDGGAEDELTLRDNRHAFERIRLIPRVLNDVSAPQIASDLLGTSVQAPLVIAPMGSCMLAWPQADIAMARAAHAHGIIYTLSTMSTTSIERMARAVQGALWFQLYVLKDHDFNLQLIDRAQAHGYGALVVTVEIADLYRQLVETSLYVNCSKSDLNAFLAARPQAPVRTLQQIFETRQYHPMLDLLDACVVGPELPEYDPQYFRRLAAREAFQRQLTNLMAANGLDALIFPDVQVPAPTREQLNTKVWTTLTYPTNTLIASQSWLPAITVPAGMVDGRLPVGLEFMGRPYDEPTLFRLAYAFEQATHHRRAPLL